MNWAEVGGAVAAFVLGAAAVAGPWLRARRKERKLQEPWDGTTERRSRRHAPMSSRQIISLLEDSGARMPSHWADFVDARAAHMANNIVNPLVGQVAQLMTQVKETREGVADLTRIINRLIGKLLPDEPVD